MQKDVENNIYRRCQQRKRFRLINKITDQVCLIPTGCLATSVFTSFSGIVTLSQTDFKEGSHVGSRLNENNY